ncbi:MAG: hypothetical protein ACI9XU_000437 [Arenicella sp.]|jgi:hypothetical protein
MQFSSKGFLGLLRWFLALPELLETVAAQELRLITNT